jgi:hypothetical protein
MREKVIYIAGTQPDGRSLRHQKRLFHSEAVPMMPIGCNACTDQKLCGGLRVSEPIFDCTSYCKCRAPSQCDTVCRARGDHFVSRTGEVQGFDFETVPPCASVAAPHLPNYMPLLMHGSRRSSPLAIEAVAIPLGSILDRQDGSHRFREEEELREHFMLARDAAIVISGTAEDRTIERIWALDKPEVFIEMLRKLRISAFTSPNFSVFNDVPRWDNLYNMKRIALVWQQIQQAGLFCPLHVNARTDRDWERWSEFIERRPEVTAVSFEFGTGAGWHSRESWHAAKLAHLAKSALRPMAIYVRGGLDSLPVLRSAFAEVKVIDSRPFMKAVKRQGADFEGDGRLCWTATPTTDGEELDDLLMLNIAACRLDALQEARRSFRKPMANRSLAMPGSGT